MQIGSSYDEVSPVVLPGKTCSCEESTCMPDGACKSTWGRQTPQTRRLGAEAVFSGQWSVRGRTAGTCGTAQPRSRQATQRISMLGTCRGQRRANKTQQYVHGAQSWVTLCVFTLMNRSSTSRSLMSFGRFPTKIVAPAGPEPAQQQKIEVPSLCCRQASLPAAWLHAGVPKPGREPGTELTEVQHAYLVRDHTLRAAQ